MNFVKFLRTPFLTEHLWRLLLFVFPHDFRTRELGEIAVFYVVKYSSKVTPTGVQSRFFLKKERPLISSPLKLKTHDSEAATCDVL